MSSLLHVRQVTFTSNQSEGVLHMWYFGTYFYRTYPRTVSKINRVCLNKMCYFLDYIKSVISSVKLLFLDQINIIKQIYCQLQHQKSIA
jgi:hypothetical protein